MASYQDGATFAPTGGFSNNPLLIGRWLPTGEITPFYMENPTGNNPLLIGRWLPTAFCLPSALKTGESAWRAGLFPPRSSSRRSAVGGHIDLASRPFPPLSALEGPREVPSPAFAPLQGALGPMFASRRLVRGRLRFLADAGRQMVGGFLPPIPRFPAPNRRVVGKTSKI